MSKKIPTKVRYYCAIIVVSDKPGVLIFINDRPGDVFCKRLETGYRSSYHEVYIIRKLVKFFNEQK